MNLTVTKPHNELMNYAENTRQKFSTSVIPVQINCPTHGVQVFETLAFRANQAKCPMCDREATAQREQAEIARIKRDKAIQGGINPTYYDCDYTSWQAQGEKQQRILNFVQAWANDFAKGSENILFIGSTGTGKTMLASIVASHISDKGYTVKMLRSSDIAEQSRNTWGKYSKVTEKDLLDGWIHCDLLVIDEFGEGDIAENNSTMAKQDRERLSKIIDGRYSLGKPTIFTSNLDRNEFRLRLGDRAWDRVQQKAVLISCDWGSYRRQVAKFVEL